MSTKIEITFSVEGVIDGPLDPAVADLSPDEMANAAAIDLKRLLLDNITADDDPLITARVNVRASVRLHDDEGTGHAEV